MDPSMVEVIRFELTAIDPLRASDTRKLSSTSSTLRALQWVRCTESLTSARTSGKMELCLPCTGEI